MSPVLWQVSPPTLFERLDAELRSGNWKEAIFAVAFASGGGVRMLAPAIAKFREDGGKVYVYVGVGRRGTSFDALRTLLETADETWIVHNPANGVLYHPKVYLLGGATAGCYIVGSGNLTAGGLVRNLEAHIVGQVANVAEEPYASLRRSVLDLPQAIKRQLDERFLAELRDKGYLSAEPEPGAEGEEAGVAAPAQLPLEGFEAIRPPTAPTLPGREAAPGRRRPAPAVPRPATVANAVGLTSFVMRLGGRDVSQERGYSREVYVPLAARSAHPDFWQWPDGFVDVPGRTGHYLQRSSAMFMQLPGRTGLETHRIFGYREKGEFRINTGLLPASEGDLLVLSLSTRPGVEYDFRIVAQDDPDFRVWDGIAAQTIPNSPKRFGYR